jgi:hypothetical protein
MNKKELLGDGSHDFTLNKKPGKVLSAIVNMSNPIDILEREVGGIYRIMWDHESHCFYYDSVNNTDSPSSIFEGERVSNQFCVEVGGFKDQIESYHGAMFALLSLGKERFHANAYELTGLMSYLWEKTRIIQGKENDYIGFASAIFYKQTKLEKK